MKIVGKNRQMPKKKTLINATIMTTICGVWFFNNIYDFHGIIECLGLEGILKVTEPQNETLKPCWCVVYC